MLPCTCGHGEHEHQTDDGSCRTCGCRAFLVEGSNCEPVTEGGDATAATAPRGWHPEEEPSEAAAG